MTTRTWSGSKRNCKRLFRRAGDRVGSLRPAWVAQVIAGRDYLAGGQLTEADVRAFVTLARFESAYYGLFKTNLRPLASYPGVMAFLARIHALRGAAETVDREHIKQGYCSLKTLNPLGIVPVGLALKTGANRAAQKQNHDTKCTARLATEQQIHQAGQARSPRSGKPSVSSLSTATSATWPGVNPLVSMRSSGYPGVLFMTGRQSQSTKQPSLFVAHGAPDLILSDVPARSFLEETGPRLAKTAQSEYDVIGLCASTHKEGLRPVIFARWAYSCFWP